MTPKGEAGTDESPHDGQPSVSVAVVTYERPSEVNRLLESLAEVPEPFTDLVVVDDSDSDRTETVVDECKAAFESRGIEVLYRRRDAPDGLPGARNLALDVARGDVICYLDDDTVVMPEWLPAIRRGFSREEVVGIGGPAILTDDELEPVVPIGRMKRNQNVVTRYGEVKVNSDRWIPPRPTETDVLEGSNMSFRRDAVVAAGGFDVGYRGTFFHEETDLCTRLRRRGGTLLYHPDAMVYHTAAQNGGTRTTGRDDRRAHYWAGRNLIRYRWHNHRTTFLRGLLRLLFWSTYPPGPVWKQCLAALIERDVSKLSYLKGYLHGLVYERG